MKNQRKKETDTLAKKNSQLYREVNTMRNELQKKVHNDVYGRSEIRIIQKAGRSQPVGI
jgi:hypothetical protein